ncbi:MAG: hypothetical protein R3194_01475 [Limnobacter sp.]|nr:hypothetical protein [Limnobacter sp.]
MPSSIEPRSSGHVTSVDQNETNTRANSPGLMRKLQAALGRLASKLVCKTGATHGTDHSQASQAEALALPHLQESLNGLPGALVGKISDYLDPTRLPEANAISGLSNLAPGSNPEGGVTVTPAIRLLQSCPSLEGVDLAPTPLTVLDIYPDREPARIYLQVPDSDQAPRLFIRNTPFNVADTQIHFTNLRFTTGHANAYVNTANLRNSSGLGMFERLNSGDLREVTANNELNTAHGQFFEVRGLNNQAVHTLVLQWFNNTADDQVVNNFQAFTGKLYTWLVNVKSAQCAAYSHSYRHGGDDWTNPPPLPAGLG